MSDAYGEGLFGKTILCRKTDAKKLKSIADLNKPTVRIMINPGGTNEKFACANLPNAKLIVHEENADIMITETVEAFSWVKREPRLAAPLTNYINFVLAELRMDGTLENLEIKYLGRKTHAAK